MIRLQEPLYMLGLVALIAPLLAHLRGLKVSEKIPFSALRFLFYGDRQMLKRIKRLNTALNLTRISVLAAVVFLFSRPVYQGVSSKQSVPSRTNKIIVFWDTEYLNRLSTSRREKLVNAARKRAQEELELSKEEDEPETVLVNCRGEIESAPTLTQALCRLKHVERKACNYDTALHHIRAVGRTAETLLWIAPWCAPREIFDLYNLVIQPEITRNPSKVTLLGVQSLGGRRYVLLWNPSHSSQEVKLVFAHGSSKTQKDRRLSPGQYASIEVPDEQTCFEGVVLLEQENRTDESQAVTQLPIVCERGEPHKLVLLSPVAMVGQSRNDNPAFFVVNAIQACLKTDPVFNRSLKFVEVSQLAPEDLEQAQILALLDPQPFWPELESAVENFLTTGGAIWVMAGPNFAQWSPDSKLFPGLKAYIYEPAKGETTDIIVDPSTQLGALLGGDFPSVDSPQQNFFKRYSMVSWNTLEIEFPVYLSRGVPLVSTEVRSLAHVVLWHFLPAEGWTNIQYHSALPALTCATLHYLFENSSQPRSRVTKCIVDKECYVYSGQEFGVGLMTPNGRVFPLAGRKFKFTPQVPGVYYFVGKGEKLPAAVVYPSVVTRITECKDLIDLNGRGPKPKVRNTTEPTYSLIAYLSLALLLLFCLETLLTAPKTRYRM